MEAYPPFFGGGPFAVDGGVGVVLAVGLRIELCPGFCRFEDVGGLTVEL